MIVFAGILDSESLGMHKLDIIGKKLFVYFKNKLVLIKTRKNLKLCNRNEFLASKSRNCFVFRIPTFTFDN